MNSTRSKRVLGTHTCVPHIQKKRGFFANYSRSPMLEQNLGWLPPALLCTGNRQVVRAAPKILNLQDSFQVDIEAKDFGLNDGRIALALGTYRNRVGVIPLAIFESQMGMDASQIIVREMIANSSLHYSTNPLVKFDADSIYLIRVGTSAGVRSRDDVDKGTAAKIGDLLISEGAIGMSFAIIQSLCGVFETNVRYALNKWKSMGGLTTQDGKFFLIKSAGTISDALEKSAVERRLGCKRGLCFSKASLYAESNESDFERLKTDYGVIMTEMEQLMIGFERELFSIKEGLPVSQGMVCAAIGEIPYGNSFPDNENEIKKAETAKENMLKIAADALVRLIYKLK
ncbi:hypothetical protein JXB01_01465 [Candidatus Micrarchaeota archaeon]|nr:hypothetical protein [Candidatus Micrarchaeota archaeon]